MMEASWRALGALLEASRAEKKIFRAALGRSKRNLKTGFSHLGGQKAPKRVPKRGPKRGPKATQAQKSDFFEN